MKGREGEKRGGRERDGKVGVNWGGIGEGFSGGWKVRGVGRMQGGERWKGEGGVRGGGGVDRKRGRGRRSRGRRGGSVGG